MRLSLCTDTPEEEAALHTSSVAEYYHILKNADASQLGPVNLSARPPVAPAHLSSANGFARTLTLQLITALAGSTIGLAVGFIAVVYVLGVW